jgi:hypothetical protein
MISADGVVFWYLRGYRLKGQQIPAPVNGPDLAPSGDLSIVV